MTIFCQLPFCRNTINTLYSNQIEEKKDALKSDSSYSNVMYRFEALGNAGLPPSRSDNQNSLSWTTFCILFAAGIGLVVVSFPIVIVVMFFYISMLEVLSVYSGLPDPQSEYSFIIEEILRE